MITYPIAPNGIYTSIQGEGLLSGVPMVFVRLAGCSVGCKLCDTDYSVSVRMSIADISEVVRTVRGNRSWVWVTGGEPADHELCPLLEEMRLCGRVGLATSGAKHLGGAGRLLDFLSVSPHGRPSQLVVRSGSQINLVPGLGDLDLDEWRAVDLSGFVGKFVTPLTVCGAVDAASLNAAIEFVQSIEGWRLGNQSHASWGVE